MPVYFIDTNVFLRLLVGDDEKMFHECRVFIGTLPARKAVICTSTVVLLEVYFTLTSFYKFDKKRVAQALESILALPRLKIADNFNHAQALSWFSNKNVRFVGCLLASLPIFAKKAIIISYDKDFDKLGLKRLEPRQVAG